MKHIKYHMILCLLLTVLLCGCRKNEMVAEPGEGAYQVYYLNSSLTKLVPQKYEIQTKDTDKLLQELMLKFVTVPQDVDVQLALPDKIGYKGLAREDNMVYVYFDETYTTMKSTREILCRAALVKTLTQLPDVDYVSIYIGEQPLMNSAGEPVGLMTGNDFIESITNINSYDKVELTLYFTDEKGEKLIPETRDVVYNMTNSMEKLIIDELLAGPEKTGLYPTLSADTKLLNVSVTDKVCYLNFDETFLSGIAEIKDYIPIYSIVNSLSELSTVNKVQISVNGDQNVMFMDSISLNTLFERNIEDYIGGQ